MRPACLAIPILLATLSPAQLPTEEFTLEKLPGSKGFALGPKPGSVEPEKGRALLVVLPGGPGTPDFLPWVQAAVGHGVPDGWVGMMLTAVRWNDEQENVWPVRGDRVRGMEFTTEEYVTAAVKHAQERWKIDGKRVYLLAWSSSGPAAYEIALSNRQPFAGFFVAMSVFRPKRSSSLSRAKGQRFFLYQSPEDQMTPIRFAEQARDELGKKGATVWLDTYAGGHGWHGDAIGRLRRGLQWLDSDAEPPEAEVVVEAPAAAGGAAPAAVKLSADNLIENGGFERGTDSWLVLDNSGTLEVERVAGGVEGRFALHLEKTGRMPMDLVRQDVSKLPKSGKLRVSASVKTKAARNAFVKFFLYDENDAVITEDVDIANLRGDSDWKRIEKTYDLDDRARYGVFMVVMVLGGEVWIDAVEIAPAK